MRCKPGELAIVVRAAPDWRQKFIGRIVRVVRLHDPKNLLWETDPPFFSSLCQYVWVNDDCLRPIRPDAEPEIVKRETEETA